MDRLVRNLEEPLAGVELAPGNRTPDPGSVPLDPPKRPPPLPPGGRLPGEVPPLPEEDEPEPDGDPTVRDPGRRMPPDHLPGGPTNPNPHHAQRQEATR
ncbi:hypothetical protein [Salinarimonas rosea]|uniref:hypothetical protein n=1 Tax=Salinarimonas rosea TaxID=552063 RepID=UPI0003FD9F49|nr:hypothetical protein [Salinarimonas rosea]